MNCEYSCDVEYQIIGSVCRCKVMGYNSEVRETISDIDGLPEHSNVEMLLIDDQKMKLLPSNLNISFPNLKGLIIDSSTLISITREDLKQFPNLKFVMIGNNNIELLNDNLFEDNEAIEWLAFINNFTKRIGSDILNPLKNLKFANFQRNTCVNFKANEASEIDRLKILIRQNCNL